ncbi:PRD domain-containing protein [Enterococcus saccharolyticus]|uniref:BglG family transcription antiterminator LicT n=1 Tax=Enterococcus saccharolyticus TaxID=41997 RepID=UPI001E54E83F|nr:PRD domain-containing protein [Enterococcus saccharolyticus]MCD5002576.1 PRD domain-containing protein [Enterococcus saccharolyticus]
MKILRILNNNVVIALNDEGEEVVLMGNGLGFQKKPGFEVDVLKVEKTFEMSGQFEKLRIEKLFAEIPEEIIKISYEILSYARKQLQKDLNETTFIAIADHLYTAIQRTKNNIQMKNFLLWDVKRFFPDELEIARQAIQVVNQRMGIQLSDDEAGFLTLHIVNAAIDSTNESAIDLTQMIEEILTVIKYTLKINFIENDIYFQRFITHLRFFSERVLNPSHNKIEEDMVENELFTLVVRKYPEAFEATKKVVDLLKTRWDYNTSRDEQVYITIHIARIIEKMN